MPEHFFLRTGNIGMYFEPWGYEGPQALGRTEVILHLTFFKSWI